MLWRSITADGRRGRKNLYKGAILGYLNGSSIAAEPPAKKKAAEMRPVWEPTVGGRVGCRQKRKKLATAPIASFHPFLVPKRRLELPRGNPH